MSNIVNPGVIGGTSSSDPKSEAKLNSLTMLLGDEDNFADMFAQKIVEKKNTMPKNKPKQNVSQNDHIETLLSNLNKFQYKGNMHIYDNADHIFYSTEPTKDRNHKAECTSCDTKFESTKQVKFC